MPSVLDETWIGRRVVLRRVLGGGPGARPRYSDALGDLVALDGSEAVVQTRAGAVRVPRASIAIARLIEPAPREVYALEAIAERGWRAREVELNPDGWLLRADSGWTGRANSVLPLRTLTRALDDVLAEVGAWYAARGQRPMIQVPLPAASGLDRALAGRGWTFPEEVLVLVSRLDLLQTALVDRPVPEGTVSAVSARPDASWLASYHYRGGELPATAEGLLLRHDRVAFAAVRTGTAGVVATARGAVDEGWLGLTAVEVDPDHRRQGAGGAVMAALVRWAVGQAATHCYLQVSAGNTPALALYRRLGFHQHHSYHYRVPPTINA